MDSIYHTKILFLSNMSAYNLYFVLLALCLILLCASCSVMEQSAFASDGLHHILRGQRYLLADETGPWGGGDA